MFVCCFFPEPNVLAGTLVAHTDAVWGLAYSGIKNQLLSCSADGTIRLWNPQEKLPCICTYNGDKGEYILPYKKVTFLIIWKIQTTKQLIYYFFATPRDVLKEFYKACDTLFTPSHFL